MAGSPTEHVARRTLEIWTALGVALSGAIVVAESLTHDIGWNETGPGSGYFPFRVGLLLIGVAVVRLVQARGIRRTPDAADVGVSPNSTTDAARQVFVTREELQRSLSVFWPTAALVAAMPPLGCYVPSAAYLAWMMRRHGGHGWAFSAAYGVAVAAVFFVIFDLWFKVPLAKGPLEAALGVY